MTVVEVQEDVRRFLPRMEPPREGPASGLGVGVGIQGGANATFTRTADFRRFGFPDGVVLPDAGRPSGGAGLGKAMYPIVEARFLAPEVKLFRIMAPAIARKRQPGQFVILRVHDQGERVPLTIADSDPELGTITLVVQGVGHTTRLLNTREAGDGLSDVVGPLGAPSHISKVGRVVVIGGGLGTAIAYPTAKAFKAAGNEVWSILGARSREWVILEEEVRAISDRLLVMTDDGSYGEKGLVTDKLRTLVESDSKPDFVLAIGPIPMMRAVAEVTRVPGIATWVSLNPIMVDGTGMCGGCRVMVGGQSKFACVDGPEFDAHQVDFGILIQRNAMYRDHERKALEADVLRSSEATCHSSGKDCRLVARVPELEGAWRPAVAHPPTVP